MMEGLSDSKVFEVPTDPDTGEQIDTRGLLPNHEELPEEIVVRRDAGGRVTMNLPHRFTVHSPSGLNYGYGGSGPADLALNILAAFVMPCEAYRLHQRFKWGFVATMDGSASEHHLSTARVREWIEAQW